MKHLSFSRCFTDNSRYHEGVSATVYMEEENMSLVVAELYAIYRCILFKPDNSSSDFLIFTDSLCSILLLSDQYGKSN